MTASGVHAGFRRFPGVVPVAAAAFLLYAPFLGSAPAYLGQDEVFFGVTAHSIASTARDLNGRVLPLYFQWPGRVPAVWFQPIPVYLTALFLRVLPLSEWSIRLPTLVLGLADVVLVYFVGRRIFKDSRTALMASALLILTPAQLIHSRIAMDFIYPVTFVLAWLWCLLVFLERRRLSMLFAATSCLGIGFYSYIASIALMPIYALITAVVVARVEPRPWRPLLAAFAGFAWPLAAAAVWLIGHSAAVVDTAQRYGLEGVLSPASTQGASALAAAAAITERVSLYWRYFDPAYLFVAGGGYAVNTTHRVGVFLAPVAVFLVAGLYVMVSGPRTWARRVLVLGFLTAPLAACLVAEPYAVQRELVILPFAALIAASGVEWLLGDARGRRAAAFLVALMLAQFSIFYVDYFTTYQARSTFAFGGNIRGGLEEILRREPPGEVRPVYLSTDITFVDLYWRFYATKHGRRELLEKTVYFDPRIIDLHAIPERSLVLARPGGTAPAFPGPLRTVGRIASLDATVCCEVLEKSDARAIAQ